MKKLNLILLIITLSILPDLTIGQNLEWVRHFSAPYGQNEGKSIAIDSMGNVYIAGDFAAINDFDPGPGVYNISPMGGIDGFVCKLDNTGNLVWVSPIHDGGNISARGVALDLAGNV